MQFYYLDESGCNGKDISNSEQPVFVLGGVSVRDVGWYATLQSVENLLTDFFGNSLPSDLELHAAALLSPRGEGPFTGRPMEERTRLAIDMLRLLSSRSHHVHLFAIDKSKLRATPAPDTFPYGTRVPYLLAYDYLITYIEWHVAKHLGKSARGMLIVDTKPELQDDIESIARSRRQGIPKAQRLKRIVEFTYPTDSRKNPMVQLSDLVAYCTRKFLEVECGYRDNYTEDTKKFYADCYTIIQERVVRKKLVPKPGKHGDLADRYLEAIQAKPLAGWRGKYF